jgi:hypothetical protein
MSTPRQELSVYGAEHAYPPYLAEGLGNCANDPSPDDFTEDGTRTRQERDARERARVVCYGCPFLLPCRAWAIDTKQQGVYGATTTAERRLINERRSSGQAA